MSTNVPNLKQIGGGHRKTLVDLTWNDPIVSRTNSTRLYSAMFIHISRLRVVSSYHTPYSWQSLLIYFPINIHGINTCSPHPHPSCQQLDSYVAGIAGMSPRMSTPLSAVFVLLRFCIRGGWIGDDDMGDVSAYNVTGS